MFQDYSQYDSEAYRVWRLLFSRQFEQLSSFACQPYLTCLQDLYPVLSPDHPPRFSDLNRLLRQRNGWSIEVVDGFLDVKEFFHLLTQRRFPSSTWLRKMDQLDYLEEPDMFHDIFGHIPLFMDKAYGNYAEKLGQIGMQFLDDDEMIRRLQRLYWFTVEFGLMRDKEGQIKAYGAGICSSIGEVKHIHENPEVEIVDFELDEVLEREFIISEVQKRYYVIDSFEQLYGTLEELERRFRLQAA